MFSSGTVDTVGTFMDSGSSVLDYNNDAGDVNFQLFETVTNGNEYYLKVEGYNGDQGSTDISIEFSP